MDLISWRAEKGLKQFEAASAIGISPAQLSRIERGEQWPEPDTLLRIESGTDGQVTANDVLTVYRAAQADKASAA